MDLGAAGKKIKNIPGKAAESLLGFLPALQNAFARTQKKLKSLTNRFLGRLPKEKKIPVLICLGGLAAILVILIITSIAAGIGGTKRSAASNTAISLHIPPDEFFIPSEPDFVPDFLLGREPRQSWSVETIRPFWRSPGNHDLWRGEIKTAVELLLEAVP